MAYNDLNINTVENQNTESTFNDIQNQENDISISSSDKLEELYNGFIQSNSEEATNEANNEENSEEEIIIGTSNKDSSEPIKQNNQNNKVSQNKTTQSDSFEIEKKILEKKILGAEKTIRDKEEFIKQLSNSIEEKDDLIRELKLTINRFINYTNNGVLTAEGFTQEINNFSDKYTEIHNKDIINKIETLSFRLGANESEKQYLVQKLKGRVNDLDSQELKALARSYIDNYREQNNIQKEKKPDEYLDLMQKMYKTMQDLQKENIELKKQFDSSKNQVSNIDNNKNYNRNSKLKRDLGGDKPTENDDAVIIGSLSY